MNKKSIALLAYALSVILLVIAVVYFTTPADKLPHFFPGFDAGSSKAHFKHGLAAILLALGAAALGWFQSGPKAAPESPQE